LWNAINLQPAAADPALRSAYVALLMVYLDYGALGIIDVSRDMWIKEKVTLSPTSAWLLGFVG